MWLKEKHRDDGVSPVVGVMLMLVVTIIIAAVVSAMAGGLGAKTEKAPAASFIVQIVHGGDAAQFSATEMTIKHMGGDTIDTKDLQIITFFTNSSGITTKHVQSATSPVIIDKSGTDYRVPYFADMTTGYAASAPSTKDFGNFTLRTGDIMTTADVRGTAQVLGLEWDDGPLTTDNKDDTFVDPDFKHGAVVEVKLLHVPSNKYIFDREVTVL